MRFLRSAWPVLLLAAAMAQPVSGAEGCGALPVHEQLGRLLIQARGQDNAGFGLDVWASVVDRSGTVCAVAFTGSTWDRQWPAGRVVSVQKAHTANALSLPGLALASAQLYTAAQPGGSLYGLQALLPLRADLAYEGPASAWGSAADPLLGKRVGGLVAFGGGLALYGENGALLGALGVSGDTTCADHAIAWRLRHALALDWVPSGVGPGDSDQITYEGPWAQPHCQDVAKEAAVVAKLPGVRRRP